MTERRGVPPPPKAESERVAKLIGQQRRQVNQSDESLQKQNFFLVFILCYIFRSSNFFTVACLQCWNEHTLPMKSGGFLNHSDISLLWHTWPKRLVCFSLLIDCLLIISISFFIYVHYWLYLNHSRIQYILQCCMLKPWFS